MAFMQDLRMLLKQGVFRGRYKQWTQVPMDVQLFWEVYALHNLN